MIFVHNSWDLFNWHGILWYGRFLYKGAFGMVSFVMGAFGMVSFVLTPGNHRATAKVEGCCRTLGERIISCAFQSQKPSLKTKLKEIV